MRRFLPISSLLKALRKQRHFDTMHKSSGPFRNPLAADRFLVFFETRLVPFSTSLISISNEKEKFLLGLDNDSGICQYYRSTCC